ncbi:MAG: T9SS type A sorting domain-containing protein [Bacteroidetes bacterium]|nr:T9SS type A sorting domain-containing protein [Bacteroidota bacterium]
MVWNSIGERAAAGNSSIQIQYDFNDYSPIQGNNYYRLKMMDIDGTVSFSKIINIPLGVKEDNGFARVYPNPTSGNLNVEIQSTTNFETNVIAYDLVGKKIYDQKTSIEKGLNTLQIDFSNFASGVYVLQFSDVKGKIRTTKFVKE